MKGEPFEVIRGSGNVYRDVGKDNPDLRQFKANLATEIIKALDRDRLAVRKAQALTGIAAADFSRIRNGTAIDGDSAGERPLKRPPIGGIRVGEIRRSGAKER
jgi:hypothetical protein